MLQSYNQEQDEENRRTRDRQGECDHFLRLMEERLIAHRQQSEQLERSVEAMVTDLRSEMVKDIRGVGKELALDIVSLNKKIDAKGQMHGDRMRVME